MVDPQCKPLGRTLDKYHHLPASRTKHRAAMKIKAAQSISLDHGARDHVPAHRLPNAPDDASAFLQQPPP